MALYYSKLLCLNNRLWKALETKERLQVLPIRCTNIRSSQSPRYTVAEGIRFSDIEKIKIWAVVPTLARTKWEHDKTSNHYKQPHRLWMQMRSHLIDTSHSLYWEIWTRGRTQWSCAKSPVQPLPNKKQCREQDCVCWGIRSGHAWNRNEAVKLAIHLRERDKPLPL